MYKKVLLIVVAFSFLTIVLAACTIRDSSAATGPAVHMGGADFIQHTITVPKGDRLTLVDDSSSTHTMVNGSWVNGQPMPSTESGAPKVNVTTIGNDSASIGPFNTAGTFHIYCTIHGGMNLAVTVQ